jgi:hypothetical protein
MVRISSQEGELVEMHPDPASCGNADRVKTQSRIHYGKRRDEVERRLQRLLCCEKACRLRSRGYFVRLNAHTPMLNKISSSPLH